MMTTMASSNNPSESSPLLPTSTSPSRPIPNSKPARNVSFNPQVSTASPPRRHPSFPSSSSSSTTPAAPSSSSSTTLSTLNNKLRRRNSSGAALQATTVPKIGPQRTTRTAQKLKLLPTPDHLDDADEESGRDVYSQFTRIKDPTARRDAARLGKEDRAKLPRVTAYCTASSYRVEEAVRFLKGRGRARGRGVVKLFDECVYSTWGWGREERVGNEDGRERDNTRDNVRDSTKETAKVQSQPQRRFSDSALEVEETTERRREDLIDLSTSAGDTTLETGEPSQPMSLSAGEEVMISTETDHQMVTPDLDTTVHIPEIFLFEYGVVVLWGMSLKEEQRFLKEISKFEQEKLSKDDVQTEEFNFYYTREYQARIYNDFISLREKKNYMTKLAISHALAQSVKVSKSLEIYVRRMRY